MYRKETKKFNLITITVSKLAAPCNFKYLNWYNETGINPTLKFSYCHIHECPTFVFFRECVFEQYIFGAQIQLIYLKILFQIVDKPYNLWSK